MIYKYTCDEPGGYYINEKGITQFSKNLGCGFIGKWKINLENEIDYLHIRCGKHSRYIKEKDKIMLEYLEKEDYSHIKYEKKDGIILYRLYSYIEYIEYIHNPKICKEYINNGKCKDGRNCNNKHIIPPNYIE